MTRVAFWLAAVLCGPAAIIACTSDEREAPARDDGGADTGASLQDSGADSSDSSADAPADGASEKPSFDPADQPVACAGTPCAVQLVAGDRHFCARMADGTARCWGDNTRGSLGIDDPGVSGPSVDGGDAASNGWTAPVVADLEGVTQLSAGGTTTCAIADAGVRCWGGNDLAQLGLSLDEPVMDEDRHPTPTVVELPSAAVRIDLGPSSACALLESGEVWCWGDNTNKQLARPNLSLAEAPGVAGLDAVSVKRLGLGTSTGFAIDTSGELFSWGAVGGAGGSVSGRETSLTPTHDPVAIGLGPVTSFSVSATTLYRAFGTPMPPLRGIGHACAVVKGELYCWGDTHMGALGIGLAMSSILPRRALVKSDTAWAQQVAAAGDLTCIRLTDGTVQCAGDNAFAALGRDPKIRFSTGFEPTEGLEGHAVAVAAAAQSVCALLKNGQVACWGNNQKGELGQGYRDHEPHPSPVLVRF